MFFDDNAAKKPNLKPRLRLAGEAGVRVEPSDEPPVSKSARDRLEYARFQKEGAPSLLDRIDAMTRAAEEARRLEQEEAAEALQARQAEIDAQVIQDARNAQNRHTKTTKSIHNDANSKSYVDASATSTVDEDLRYEHSEDRSLAPWRHPDEPLIHPIYIINSVRKWRHLIAASTILGGLVGLGLAMSTPKLYYSMSSIIIDPRNYKVVANDINPDVFLSDAALAIVDTQLNIIRSPTVLDKVAIEQKLDLEPEFNGTRKGLLSPLFSFLNIMSGSSSPEEKVNAAIRSLNNKIEVKRQPETFLINIGAYSENPQLAADIVNKTIDVYFAERNTDRVDTAEKTSGDIGARLPELKKQLEAAETKVGQFKSENDLFDAQGRLISDETILRLNEQLSVARTTTVALNSRADSAKAITVDGLIAGGLPEEINSNALSTLRGQYTAAKQRYDGLRTKLGPRHPDLQQSENEVSSLKSSIESEIKRIRTSIQTELRRAVQTEQSLAANLATMKAKFAEDDGAFVKLRALEREAASARTVYEQLLLRSQETGEQGAIDSANVKRIGKAVASSESSGSSRKLIAIGGLLGGFALGLGLAIFLGIWNALKSQYGGFASSAGPVAPTPGNPSGSKRRAVRGVFQAEPAQTKTPFWQKALDVAQTQKARMEEPVEQTSSSTPIEQIAKSPAEAKVTPVPAPMPQMQQPQFVPVAPPQAMYMPQPMFLPQMQQPWFVPHPAMMPQMMVQQAAPVAQIPVPVEVPVQQPPAATSQAAPTPLRPRALGPNAQLSDIQDSLADMRAELVNFARQRRQA